MGSQQTIKPTVSSTVTIPMNYPKTPAPGKLEILWDANSRKLYRKLSPYTDYHQSLLGSFTSEPFFYTYADEGGKGLSGLKKYESRMFPIGSAPIDVIRVSKFLTSGNGIIFLGKQFLLQSGNAYNETRIYNPTSPIVAAGMGLVLGTVRPQRNFDTSAGLAGIARTLIGSTIPDALFGAPKINPPAGTVASALPDATLTTGGKGLLRAGTANRGYSHLSAAWPQNTQGSSLASTFRAAVTGLVKSLFANYLPQNQNGFVARSDEGTYGLMIGAAPKFVYVGRDGSVQELGQQWVAGSSTIRKTGQYPKAYRLFVDANGNSLKISNSSLSGISISGVGSVGYSVTETPNGPSPGFRYGDNMGVKKDKDYGSSDVMVQYNAYVDQTKQFPTKQTTTDNINNIKSTLNKMLADLKSTSDGLYAVNIPNDARVISSGNATQNGYDRLFATNKKNVSPTNYPQGVLQDYRSVRTIDDTVGSTVPSMRLPTAGRYDAINTLTVIPKDAIQNINNSTPNAKWKSLNMRGWENRQWTPYGDDQIALYFYDVVNETYIPFRAAIKGLTTSDTANWEEMTFIGRADKVYSYGGFNRNLGFTLSISIGSIAELGPTWKRINYLTTLIKPANYTTSTINQVTNRFMIAPMVMLTLGDMYKEQPILIQSVTCTVPDDATWETSNEFNSKEWAYLASYLSAPNVVYGQLPRQVDISLGMALLEKERAIVGGANFGSAPRTEDWSTWNTDAVPNGGMPNKFNKSLVYDVTGLTKDPTLLDAGTPFQPAIDNNSSIA